MRRGGPGAEGSEEGQNIPPPCLSNCLRSRAGVPPLDPLLAVAVLHRIPFDQFATGRGCLHPTPAPGKAKTEASSVGMPFTPVRGAQRLFSIRPNRPRFLRAPPRPAGPGRGARRRPCRPRDAGTERGNGSSGGPRPRAFGSRCIPQTPARVCPQAPAAERFSLRGSKNDPAPERAVGPRCFARPLLHICRRRRPAHFTSLLCHLPGPTRTLVFLARLRRKAPVDPCSAIKLSSQPQPPHTSFPMDSASPYLESTRGIVKPKLQPI